MYKSVVVMRGWVFYIISGILLGFFCIQFMDSTVENKPVVSEINLPDSIKTVLKQSCFNCHSNQTQLGWYDAIAPISWLVKKDVDRAREAMNLSQWNDLTPSQQKGQLWAIFNMIKSHKMPLLRYRLVHPEASVTPDDVLMIERYVQSLTQNSNITADTSLQRAIDFDEFTRDTIKLKNTPIALNGVPYIPEFKNWKVMSMSTLYDNTMRITYGNDIAIKAAEEEDFHPWPAGSIVVKSVWEQVQTETGEIRSGRFVNAQIMIKDGKRYNKTEGWGFAKFSSNQLIPFGTSADFAEKSCIGCHRLKAKETGFVFNVPPKVNSKF